MGRFEANGKPGRGLFSGAGGQGSGVRAPPVRRLRRRLSFAFCWV